MSKPCRQDSNFIQNLHIVLTKLSNRQVQHNKIADWDPKNKGFIIMNEQRFTQEVLAHTFAIGRFDSFVRKLNKYGFKRSKVDRMKFRFFHKDFTKDGNGIQRIKKLSKQQALPKHIKLRLMRQKLNIDSLSQQNDKYQAKQKQNNKEVLQSYTKTSGNKLSRLDMYMEGNYKQKQKQNWNLNRGSKQDIGIYLVKDPEIGRFKKQEQQL